jgi:uncharacterized protein (DUF3084 family)
MSAPVAAGQLTDLEAKYQAASKDYDAKVTAALATANAAAAAAAVKAKQEMVRLAEQMVSVTTETSAAEMDTKHRKFLDRLHKLQAEYDTLSASNDQLKTLQAIRARAEEKFDGPFYFFGGLFIVSCAALLATMIIKR